MNKPHTCTLICICRYEHNTTNAQAYVACVPSMHVIPTPNHSVAATHVGMDTDMFSGVRSTTQAGQQPHCPLLYPGAAPFTDQIFQHWHSLTLYDELLYAIVGKVTTCTGQASSSTATAWMVTTNQRSNCSSNTWCISCKVGPLLASNFIMVGFHSFGPALACHDGLYMVSKQVTH